MLTYNTRLKKLLLPEYGRNIQKMVDHCMSLQDKELRTKCAYSIVDSMFTLFPPSGDPEEYRRKLWDHLAIMSDFALDIDWPFEVIRPDELNMHPDPLPLPTFNISRRQYGKNLEIMIDSLSQMPDGEEKDVLALMIANHMKKMLTTSNNDVVEDEKVFRDLRDMSHGCVNLLGKGVRLHEFKALPGPSKKKKK